MKSEANSTVRKFSGANSWLKVLRTAPMYSEKQKNFTELIPHPIIPQVSIMWAFLESYLKKTADVFRLYPETRIILEQRIANLKGSFKLQSEGKVVDAEIVGTHHIIVNYLVRHSLINDTLTQQQREELFFNLQKVRAQLSNAYGTTPAVIAVDKTDRYVVDLMFMLAESVTKAISDMSDKSWIECNATLVAVLNVYRNRLSNLLERFHVFINSAELGGATTPSFHAHAMSQRRDVGVALLPDDNREDDTILTKQHFERLGPRPLDGRYITQILQEIALENFLSVVELVNKKFNPNNDLLNLRPDDGRDDLHKQGLQECIIVVGQSDKQDGLYRFLSRINNISNKITAYTAYDFETFLNDLNQYAVVQELEGIAHHFDDNAPAKVVSPQRKISNFCLFMKDVRVRQRYWRRFSDRVILSPVPDIFAASMMRKIKIRGVEEKIKAIINKTVPDGMRIDVELTDYFCFSQGEHIIPAFTFVAEPHVWSIYGKPVMEAAEEALNSHWEKIYYITEAYVRFMGDKTVEAEIIQKLDELIGVSSVLQEMSRNKLPFESDPNSLLYAGSQTVNVDIVETTQNYLRYFAKCFAYARRKKILLLPGLCPRATVIELKEIDGVLREVIQVSPISVYMPIMTLVQFERRLGPYTLLKEANARFELIGEGQDRFVIQKMGGECRTKGRPVFHRDKREHLKSRPRVNEEPLVEAISETVKQYVFTKENLGNSALLYFQHYMREYITREYANELDVSWKSVAEVLFHCGEDIYSLDAGVNIEHVLQAAFAASLHAKMEMARAHRLMCIIKEARQDAIKKMNVASQRGDRLRNQIEEGDFMATYELVMGLIQRCKKDSRFIPLLNSLNLPRNERTHEHILYIFCIRLVERYEQLKGGMTKVMRNELLSNNLNTISFFKLAEVIVEEAFSKVNARFVENISKKALDVDSCMRDRANSEYLMVELISRVIYKYISESPKRRQEYYSAVKYYYEDHPFMTELFSHIADELRRKSFQTEEHWKALGADPAQGHLGLIEKCTIPAARMGQCVINCERYGEAMNDVITIIENNLFSYTPDDTSATPLPTVTPYCYS
ncbi:hypothetical protein MBAV_003904 [Candidatus Magnetobacterium bavaricum]|uniref:Uncharacterized protein n=1 Tax=Candidatus Magnetobacterium bavaricum TaxID=29290 RepID=A0A0F3GPU0_9BACT|nr:hypothetical protein MBAV_003904 [Candidatus Magnetobacterium bavaricum]